MSSPTARCPSVSANGNRWSNASRMPPARRGLGRAGRAPDSLRRCARVSCTASASSHLSRCLAACTAGHPSGRWIQRSASGSPARENRWRSSSGSGSLGSSQMSSTCRTHRAIDQDGRPCADGYTGSSAAANSSTTAWSTSPSSSWYSGWESCSCPRNAVTLPANRPRRSGSSSRSRHAWLKNAQVRSCLPSVIRTSRMLPGRLRIRRLLTRCTLASTVTCSSTSRPAMSVSSPRSA